MRTAHTSRKSQTSLLWVFLILSFIGMLVCLSLFGQELAAAGHGHINLDLPITKKQVVLVGAALAFGVASIILFVRLALKH
jgi:hypothetical protein